jgi:hypothetical protein
MNMKPSKMLSLAAMAVMALLILATGASAAEMTNPPGTEFTGEVHETISGSWSMNSGSSSVTCTEATRIWDVTTNDDTFASGSLTGTSFSKCTSAVTVLSVGSLTVKSGGEVLGAGGELTISVFGTSCIYGAGKGVKVGTAKSGTPGVMTETAELPKISGGALCSSTATTSGEWKMTFPKSIVFDLTSQTSQPQRAASSGPL